MPWTIVQFLPTPPNEWTQIEHNTMCVRSSSGLITIVPMTLWKCRSACLVRQRQRRCCCCCCCWNFAGVTGWWSHSLFRQCETSRPSIPSTNCFALISGANERRWTTDIRSSFKDYKRPHFPHVQNLGQDFISGLRASIDTRNMWGLRNCNLQFRRHCDIS